MGRSVKLVVTTSIILFVSSMALNFVLIAYSAGKLEAAPSAGFLGKSFRTFQEAFIIIGSYFIDETKLKPQQMIYGAISGLIKSLDDPYSTFFEPESLKEFTSDTMGSFGGLGIIVSEKNGYVVVISPIRGTPAFRVGMKAGDIIVKVDGKAVQGQSLSEVVSKLKGKIGTKVKVDVFRKGESQLLPFTITRARIEQPNLEYYFDNDSKIGYIMISSFTQTTGKSVESVVTQMEKQGLRALIVDVRGNPGGLLQAAVQVGRVFLSNKVIVTTKYRTSKPMVYSAFSCKHPYYPMIVMINEGSASASEILAGAIKDNGRGILLGKKSFGKGSVQTIRGLSDGSALKITTGYYYTPSGICIHKKGINPDIEVNQRRLSNDEIQEYRKKLVELNEDQYKEGSVAGGATIPISKEKYNIMCEYDTQLIRAVELLKSALIYHSKLLSAKH
jgi:carboxyl-terminal processing protease